MKLFVYGIFLDETNRDRYGMTNPRYATVKGYATQGAWIVEAVEAPDYTLTGLIVDIPDERLPAVDSLERGYDRVQVKTEQLDEPAFMYVGRKYN